MYRCTIDGRFIEEQPGDSGLLDAAISATRAHSICRRSQSPTHTVLVHRVAQSSEPQSEAHCRFSEVARGITRLLGQDRPETLILLVWEDEPRYSSAPCAIGTL